MLDCIQLACPSCGGTLEVYQDDDRLACGHCGSEMLVRRRGGGVSLKSIEAAVRRVEVGVARVQAGTDKTAAELAISRYRASHDDLVARRAECEGRHAKASSSRVRSAVIWLLVVAFVAAVNARPEGGAAAGILIVGSLFVVGVTVWKSREQSALHRLEVDSYQRRISDLRSQIHEKTLIADA